MRAKQFLELYEAQQQLFEVEMSPSSLKKLAKNLSGVLAGIEYEMFVPDVVDDDDIEPEEDYDEDRRPNDIDDICDFFNDSDHNSRRTIQDLRDELYDEFTEWVDSEIKSQWDSEGKNYIYEWIKENVSDDDLAEYLDIKPENEDEEFEPSYQDYKDAAEKAWYDEDSYYDDAKEEYINEADRDDFEERDFLKDVGINEMSDVIGHVNTDIRWPYWTSGSEDGKTKGDVASDIERDLGFTVYTDDMRHPDGYTLTTDGSLHGYSGYGGLELISPSPPPEIFETIEEMKKIIEWAKDYGCKTNEKTGLHMNISIPGYSRGKLDYVKLVLLSGDEHMLKEFKRIGCGFAQSALQKIKDSSADKDKVKALLDNLRSGVGQIASKIIHSGMTHKYTSINTGHNNRIEVRTPGDDWINEGEDKLANTLLRYAVALDAACDPNKYRKEYYRALYKLVSPKDPKSDMSLFSRYMAGEMSKEAFADDILKLRKTRLNKGGIEELDQLDADDGDWMVTVDNGGNTTTIFLKNNKTVSNGSEAISAAQQIYPKIFNKNNIQNIVVEKYKIDLDPDLKLYLVQMGFQESKIVAKSEKEVEQIVKIIDSKRFFSNGDGEPFLNYRELDKVSKPQMKRILMDQEKAIAEGKAWLESDKMFQIRMRDSRRVTYIAAKTYQEAEIIANKIYPEFTVDDGYYVSIVHQSPLSSMEAATLREEQNKLINQRKAEREAYASQVQVENIHMYRVHNMNGYDYVMANNEKEAEEIATKMNFIKFPAGSVTAVKLELDPHYTEVYIRRQNERLAEAPKPYQIIDTRTNQPVPDSVFPVTNGHDSITRLRDYISFGRHGLTPEQAREVFAVRPVDQPSSPARPESPRRM